MSSPEHVAEAAHRLVPQAGSPAKVILFGAYARWDADDVSDLDLMIVEHELPDKATEYLRLREAICRTGVGVDLLLASEQDFKRRSQVPRTAAYWARKEGTYHMTPQREEAERFLRLTKRDQAPFATLLNAATVDPAVACFQAQQAAEKSLESVMCLLGLEYRRTHDLEELACILKDVGVAPAVDEHELRCLTPYAVEFRYDDEAVHLISGDAAGRLVGSQFAWVEEEFASHRDAR